MLTGDSHQCVFFVAQWNEIFLLLLVVVGVGVGVAVVVVLLLLLLLVVVVVVVVAGAVVFFAASSDPRVGRGGLGCLRPRWSRHLLVTGINATCAVNGVM